MPRTGKTLWVQEPTEKTGLQGGGRAKHAWRGLLGEWRASSGSPCPRHQYLYALDVEDRHDRSPDFGDIGRVNLKREELYARRFR